jgi:hypothetical protein
MPLYEYYCDANGQTLEVTHSMSEDLTTWGQLCALTHKDPGGTPNDAPIERMISRVLVQSPKGNSDLKSMGFTKLVRRDKGVYENVTAQDGEKRYMVADDTSSTPNFTDKITD